MFKIRLLFLMEILVLFSLVLGVDHFFFMGDRFWNLNAHPFLFIVLLISVQYGTNEGLITAFLAAIILLTGNLPEQKVSQDIFDYIFYVSHRPVLWITLAVFFGGFRDRYSKNLETLQERLIEAQTQAGEICKAYKRLDKERNQLETNLSSQATSALSLYKTALNMKIWEPDEILNHILDLIDNVMNTEKCSLFLLKNPRDPVLKLTSQKGWAIEECYSRTFRAEDPLFKGVIGSHKVLCIANPEDEKNLCGEGILAGPLIDKGTGKVYGMVKIEGMGFLNLNLSKIETFRVLCDWLGNLLELSRQFQSVHSQKIKDPQGHSYSMNYFGHLSQFLLYLSGRIPLEVQTLTIRLVGDSLAVQDQRYPINKKLNDIFKATFRKTDLIFQGKNGNKEFTVLLPNTSFEKAQFVSKKLMKALKEKVGNDPGVGVLSITVHSLEEKQRELDLKMDKEIYSN
ncbi:MAG: GAF domain-containing protein [Nitrospinaceae bacterium]